MSGKEPKKKLIDVLLEKDIITEEYIYALKDLFTILQMKSKDVDTKNFARMHIEHRSELKSDKEKKAFDLELEKTIERFLTICGLVPEEDIGLQNADDSRDEQIIELLRRFNPLIDIKNNPSAKNIEEIKTCILAFYRESRNEVIMPEMNFNAVFSLNMDYVQYLQYCGVAPEIIEALDDDQALIGIKTRFKSEFYEYIYERIAMKSGMENLLERMKFEPTGNLLQILNNIGINNEGLAWVSLSGIEKSLIEKRRKFYEKKGTERKSDREKCVDFLMEKFVSKMDKATPKETLGEIFEYIKKFYWRGFLPKNIRDIFDRADKTWDKRVKAKKNIDLEDSKKFIEDQLDKITKEMLIGYKDILNTEEYKQYQDKGYKEYKNELIDKCINIVTFYALEGDEEKLQTIISKCLNTFLLENTQEDEHNKLYNEIMQILQKIKIEKSFNVESEDYKQLRSFFEKCFYSKYELENKFLPETIPPEMLSSLEILENIFSEGFVDIKRLLLENGRMQKQYLYRADGMFVEGDDVKAKARESLATPEEHTSMGSKIKTGYISIATISSLAATYMNPSSAGKILLKGKRATPLAIDFRSLYDLISERFYELSKIDDTVFQGELELLEKCRNLQMDFLEKHRENMSTEEEKRLQNGIKLIEKRIEVVRNATKEKYYVRNRSLPDLVIDLSTKQKIEERVSDKITIKKKKNVETEIEKSNSFSPASREILIKGVIPNSIVREIPIVFFELFEIIGRDIPQVKKDKNTTVYNNDSGYFPTVEEVFISALFLGEKQNEKVQELLNLINTKVKTGSLEFSKAQTKFYNDFFVENKDLGEIIEQLTKIDNETKDKEKEIAKFELYMRRTILETIFSDEEVSNLFMELYKEVIELKYEDIKEKVDYTNFSPKDLLAKKRKGITLIPRLFSRTAQKDKKEAGMENFQIIDNNCILIPEDIVYMGDYNINEILRTEFVSDEIPSSESKDVGQYQAQNAAKRLQTVVEEHIRSGEKEK